MKVMLGRGGFRSEERRTPYLAATREHFGDLERVLFVPYALADHDGYVAWMHESGFDAGYELVGLHTFDDPVRAVREASAISVGGGNTFRLVRALHELGIARAIAERVRDGVPYLGVSAGSNVACPTLRTTNDMPIVEPASFDALGLVPFQINAHFFAGSTWVRAGDGLARRLEGKRNDSQGLPSDVLDVPERRVLIGGYGRMGHTVATLLQASGIPFVAFDTNPERVEQGRAYGHPVLYGDISDPELLATAHAERVTLVVLTIDHGATALRTVSHLRNTYPRVPVIVRARDLEASAHLLHAGATQAFPETIEASLRLGAEALQMVGAPADSVELLLQGVRNRGYELVRERAEGDESP